MSEEEVIEKDNEIKYYVFIKNGRRHYTPQPLPAGMATIKFIFPVPEPNTIGTLDQKSNGITFIKFGDYCAGPECKAVINDYAENIYDVDFYRFSPKYTDDTIVYTQSSRAVVVNVKIGEAFYSGCGVINPKGYLLGIRFLDPQKNLVVIVKSLFSMGMGGGVLEDHLHVAKLEGQEFVDTGWTMKIRRTDYKLMDFPKYNQWYVHDNKLFVYNHGQIFCTDGYQFVLHPFSETFNANSTRISMVKDIAIHPKLPFGVIIEENATKIQDLIVLRWDITDPKKKGKQVISFCQTLEPLKPLFDIDRLTLAYPSFSPDGNWYVIGLIGRDEWNAPQSTHFVAIPVTPVDNERPYFLDIDNIVVLGQVAGLTSIAWITDPVSYVVSNGELLHKWDLDELPNARVFEVSEDGAGEKKPSIFRKIARLFGSGK